MDARTCLHATPVLLFIAAAAGTAQADGRWIDKKPIVQWNKAGASVPRAPKDAIDREQCKDAIQPPRTPEERAVVAAGWTLLSRRWTEGEAGRDRGHPMVWGFTGTDGMCRPMGFQGFVFAEGKFAGTVSPRPMDSREDGSAETVMKNERGRLSMGFARYSRQDPLCCPSRISTVRYELRQTPNGPVLAATGASTRREKNQ
jgi:hypothetical protein